MPSEISVFGSQPSSFLDFSAFRAILSISPGLLSAYTGSKPLQPETSLIIAYSSFTDISLPVPKL